ncbi:radical SAM protein [Engelhardtia mirabilis]|uniref:Pyrroloquinoline quinone biosynthesis protein PqqE n=1 Tax=Engelhardtia mirabilis TaxID=2528011 RepID=A0A518BM76_9BACT|nr:pyrroloquinoline quinone biosynthesis protein PqqE [Planctomycetes bacterium Pla133]QDV02408.1 pyrroloquinoline quinone biosynthesis protein PqqE [Planctomycetes bacterium Pla86]
MSDVSQQTETGQTTPKPSGGRKYEREVANFVALTGDLAAGRLEWSSRPYYLEYSTNSACNLRCIMCSQVENPPVVSTPLDLQEDLLDALLPLTTIWTPSATSEPLLNNFKRLRPMLEKHQVALDIITNAMLLTPAVLEGMLPFLHRLTLSVDSHKPEVFEKLRAPADFATVIEHSRHATRVCREHGIPVVYHMVLAHECLPDLEDYVDFVADLGGSRITVLELLPNSPQFQELDPFQRDGEQHVAARLESMRARAEERGVGIFFEVREPLGGEYNYAPVASRINSGTVLEMMHGELGIQHEGFCPMVAGYFKVEPDGRAYPCCRAPVELELGNVLEEGFEGVWNGEKMQKLRKRMFERDYPQPCVGCAVLEGPRWRAEARRREAGETE